MMRSIVLSLALATSAFAYSWNGRGGHPYIPPAAPKSDKPKADGPKAEKKKTVYGRPGHLEAGWLGNVHTPNPQSAAYGSRQQLDASPALANKPWAAEWTTQPPLQNVGTVAKGAAPGGSSYGTHRQLDGARQPGAESSYAAAWLTAAPSNTCGTTGVKSSYGGYGNRHLDGSAPMADKPWAAEWVSSAPLQNVGTANAPSQHSGYGNMRLDSANPKAEKPWAADWLTQPPLKGVGTTNAPSANYGYGHRHLDGASRAGAGNAYAAPWLTAAPSNTCGTKPVGRNWAPQGGAAVPPPPPAAAPQGYAPPPAAAAYAPPAYAPPTYAPPAAAGGAPHLGSGGMADTRDPEPMKHDDPRKSISAAPSFEEYMKQRG